MRTQIETQTTFFNIDAEKLSKFKALAANSNLSLTELINDVIANLVDNTEVYKMTYDEYKKQNKALKNKKYGKNR